MLAINRTRRVDWSRVIDNLLRAGMTLDKIAEQVGVARRTIGLYRDGDLSTEPAFWVGVKLLKLWSDKTGIAWADAPLHTVQPSVSQILRESN
jgi:hypothetical protein